MISLKTGFIIFSRKISVFFLIPLLVISPFFAAPISYAQAQTISLPAEMNKDFAPSNIPVGGISVLTVNIYNPNAFALTLPSIPAAWTDTLPTAITFANPADATTTCGGTVSMVGQTLSLIGGSVPAQTGSTPGTCKVTVKVTSIVPGNHDNVIPANSLKATDPTGAIQVSNTTPAARTLQVLSVQPPSLNKQFVPNTQWVGIPSQLRVNIRNNDLNNALTAVSLTDSLPNNIQIANTTVSFSNCGGSAQVTGPGGIALAAGQTSFTIQGAEIPANSTCTATVNIVSTVPGVYSNVIPASAIRCTQGVTNATAATAPINYQAIGMTKAFSPSTFEAGSQAAMTITLQNPSGSPYTGVSFTDTLPAGLTIAVEPTLSQCGGTITYTSNSITLTGGTVPAASGTPGTCTVTALVTSSISGSYTNSISTGSLTTDQGATNVTNVTSNVSVYAPGTGMSGSKSFSPSTIPVGGVSRLTINLRAPVDISLTDFSVTDALPSGVRVAAVPNPTKNPNCVGGIFAPAAGNTSITYSGGEIPAGAQCTLAVNVTSDTKGSYANIISPLNISNAENRNLSGNISATLTVSGISVSKSFYPSTVNINGISTLTVILTNTNPSQLNNVTFIDTLPANLVLDDDPKESTTCGTTVNATGGGLSFSISGGTIPAQVGAVPGICTINVNVKALTTGNKTNRIPVNTVSGVVQSSGITITNPAEATAVLAVADLTIAVNKEILPLTVFGGAASTMTVRLTNPNNAVLTGITFTDYLPESTDPLNPGKMTVAIPAQVSTGTCGGSITIAPDRQSFKFEGGSLAANTFCELKINITHNVSGNLTNTIGANEVTSTNGAKNPQAASSSLTNLAGASLTKYFTVNPVPAGSGNLTTLHIIIQNTSNVNLTQLGFTDEFPAGLSVAEAPTAEQCGGFVTYTPNSVTLSDGALEANGSCTVAVNLAADGAGSYLNCIPAETLTSYQQATNTDPTCDTLVVEQSLLPPAINKAFAPNPVNTGASSALTFTITNPNSQALSGVAFSDTFPAGLERFSVPNASQCGGTVSSTANSVSLSGGSIAANGNCTVTIAVKSDTGGVYNNTSNAVTSSNGGTGNTASDSLTVIAPPVISKTFSPNPAIPNQVSTLTFIITNPAENTVALSGVSFTDTFPTGLTRAEVPTAEQCGGTVSSTNTSVSFSGGTIAAGASCTVNIDVKAANGGNYANTSGVVISTNGGTGNTASDTLVVNGVGLALEKSSSSTKFQAAGDIVTYSYRLINTGNDELYSPFTIIDDKIAGPFDCGGASEIPIDGAIICTATYTITADDVAAKWLTNTATASAKDATNSDVFSNESSRTLNLTALSLIKSASRETFLTTGTTITYTYTLTNTGAATLYAPFMVIDDKFTTPLTCSSITSLQPSGVTTCTRNYSTTSVDVTNGFVTNIASATAKDAETDGNTVTSNEASKTLLKVIAPSVTKAFSPNPVSVGSPSTLTFTITNPNPVSLTGVGLIDNLPAGLTPVITPSAAQCGGTVAYNSSLNRITLSGGSIIPNSFCTVTVLVSAASPGDYINTSNAVTSSNAGNGNTATSTLSVVTAPLISKQFNPTAIAQGETSMMTITISNPPANTQPLSGVAFVDNLPSGMQVSGSESVTISGCGTPNLTLNAGDTQINFSNGSIAVMGTCSIQVPVTTTLPGVFNNQTEAVTSSNGGGGVQSNIATLTVSTSADLSVNKNDGTLASTSGQSLSYQVTASNAGPSDAPASRFVDIFPTTLTDITWTCIADSGATCPVSGSGNIDTLVDLPAGKSVVFSISARVVSGADSSVINTAVILPPAGISDGYINNNVSSDINSLNLLNIEKTSTDTNFDTLDQELTYSYTITNIGTSTLQAPFLLMDDKAEITCTYPTSLAPAAQFTCSGTYDVTLQDLDNGFIINQASVTGTDPDGDTVISNLAELTIEATQSPLIGAAKRIVQVQEISAGTYDITYELVIENFGNVTISNIQMRDNLNATFATPLPAVFSVKSIDSNDFTVNPLYDGSLTTDMLAGSDSLSAFESGRITLVVTVVPTSGGPNNNSAVASASHPTETLIQDTSHNGAEPVPGGDGTPDQYNDPTPLEFGTELFDPPIGVKTVDATGRPVLEWTMVWINNSNLADVAGFVSDPIPADTEYLASGVDSGFALPGGEPDGSTSVGVTCTTAGSSVTTLCYYQGPDIAAGYPLGRVIWQGIIGPDFGVTDPALTQNAVTIKFSVLLQNNPTSVVNRATINSDRDGDGDTLDANEQQVAVVSETWKRPMLPSTGFAPNRITSLPKQPIIKAYTNLDDMRLEIPTLGVNLPIVGVPASNEGWDLTWLGQQAGWLNGTTFPTWKGNSAITAHVYDANGYPGPFSELHQMKWGDQIVVQAFGQKYFYEVRSVNEWVEPSSVDAIPSENYPWLTLITCKGFNESDDTYRWRVVVRAVQVRVE